MVKNNISQRLDSVRAMLPDKVRLVAVSKYHPISAVREAYSAGQRLFGESREQELAEKHAALPEDISWHFIGHLQTNKVRFIVPYVSMIDSVDSLKLLCEIEHQAARCERVIDVLLELHIAEETSKYGLTPADCRALLEEGKWRKMEHVRICGLMMMASNVDNEEQLREEFTTAARFFEEVKRDFFSDASYFCERSWGMSGDYPIAVECGSTMVRVGTAIFGEREY